MMRLGHIGVRDICDHTQYNPSPGIIYDSKKVAFYMLQAKSVPEKSKKWIYSEPTSKS